MPEAAPDARLKALAQAQAAVGRIMDTIEMSQHRPATTIAVPGDCQGPPFLTHLTNTALKSIAAQLEALAWRLSGETQDIAAEYRAAQRAARAAVEAGERTQARLAQKAADSPDGLTGGER